MGIKGYAIWKHEPTINQDPISDFIHYSTVYFSDGYNILSCEAIGVGPFWITTSVHQTLVGCVISLQNGGKSCPEGYFGVSP